MKEGVDSVSLVAGLAIIAVGAILLLETEEVIDLSLGVVGAVVSAVIGVVLLAGGLAEGGDGD